MIGIQTSREDKYAASRASTFVQVIFCCDCLCGERICNVLWYVLCDVEGHPSSSVSNTPWQSSALERPSTQSKDFSNNAATRKAELSELYFSDVVFSFDHTQYENELGETNRLQDKNRENINKNKINSTLLIVFS